MSLTPADVVLAESLIDIALKARAAFMKLAEDKPEVYEAISQHHRDALTAANEELAKP